MKLKSSKSLIRYSLSGLLGITVLLGALLVSADSSRSDISVGGIAPAFNATSTAGQAIKFPGDFKGKIVLIDFWATWCPPCRAEIPNVVKAYEKYHDAGLEIISISLDKSGNESAVAKFNEQNKMTWPQLYDGGYWKAAIATQYGVHAIPCPVLVDGDTGKVLAEGSGATGKRLFKEIASAIKSKTGK